MVTLPLVAVVIVVVVVVVVVVVLVVLGRPARSMSVPESSSSAATTPR